MPPSHSSRRRSSSLSEETDSDSTLLENEAFLKGELQDDLVPGHQRKWSQALLWKLSTFFLVALSGFLIALNLWTWCHYHPLIRQSDFGDARKAIQYEQRKFTGTLVFDKASQRVVRVNDAPVEYAGPPSQEIDDAWTELIRDRFLVLNPEEARPFLPSLTKFNSTNRYHFEPDVFHTLHCLNSIRAELSKSMYPESAHKTPEHFDPSILPPGYKAAHIDHCVDRLRQVVMCHGDLSPAPIYSMPGSNFHVARTETHTCRRWEPIREWMDERRALGKGHNVQEHE